MFRCAGGGGHLSAPGEKPITIVTEIRLTESNHFVDTTLDMRRCRVRVLGRPGFETAKAIQLCPEHLSEAPREPTVVNPGNPKRIEQIRFGSSRRESSRR